jgi:3-dehydroquinate dehydratase-2
VKISVLHGPNLNLLGSRETEVYGCTTLADINRELYRVSTEASAELEVRQSNHEGELVTFIQAAASDGLIVNPAAYTHTSVAIRDAIAATRIPCVEVHISNIHAREDFRHNSLIAPVCRGQVSGFGGYGYILAMKALLHLLAENEN